MAARKTITNSPAAAYLDREHTAWARLRRRRTCKRFLVGPKGCEITGITATPDLKTLFVNIQHPGESGNLVPPCRAAGLRQTELRVRARPLLP